MSFLSVAAFQIIIVIIIRSAVAHIFNKKYEYITNHPRLPTHFLSFSRTLSLQTMSYIPERWQTLVAVIQLFIESRCKRNNMIV